jgi:hypothetical protein
MKLKLIIQLFFLVAFLSTNAQKKNSDNEVVEVPFTLISSITNKAPYNPKPGMQQLRNKNEKMRSNGKIKLRKPMHFLVFGDSKGSEHLQDVLKRADLLEPQFCLTTADLVNKGAGEIGEQLYKDLDNESGWFFRKYPTWPTLGNHEVSGSKENTGEENYASGVENFGDFFGLKDPFYSFTYGNAKFIALDWAKVSESQEKFDWLEKELKEAQGMHIFIFKHRPNYTVGNKSYSDVEGKSTVATELYTKYKVTAVFSGHDHLYYRTLRNGVNYIVSSGAGAYIYELKREDDAIPGDAYYGREVENKNEFRFHPSKGEDIKFNKAMYYVLSVKVRRKKVTFEMIDTKGKTWDKFSF